MANFSYTTNPGYKDLFVDLGRAIQWHYRPENWGDYEFPRDFYKDVRHYFNAPIEDIFPVLYIALAFTLTRYAFNAFISNPVVNWLRLNKESDRPKFHESFWKFLVYSATWSACCYLLLLSGKYTYFTEPWTLWDDWAIDMVVPDDIKILYYIECGFYVHSIYATLYMDAVRKDFFAMLVHHVLTVSLLTFSYCTKYHKTGILVLFCHDVSDVMLEFTKLNVYLKNRNGKYYPFHEYISNIGFVGFALVWFVFRLYWFPLRILYTSSVISTHVAAYRGAGLYLFFNSMMWILLVLDIYWFYFIMLFLYKVATGQLKEIEDTREDAPEEKTLVDKKQE